jgi:hypothetical protein
LFPILEGTWVESEATGELRAAKAGGGADGTDVYIEWEREMMRCCGRQFALGDCGGFAHGFD